MGRSKVRLLWLNILLYVVVSSLVILGFWTDKTVCMYSRLVAVKVTSHHLYTFLHIEGIFPEVSVQAVI